MKKLYIDSSPKKANIKGLNKGKAIIKKIASIGLTLSIFSGGQKLLQQIDKDLVQNITVSNATEVSDNFIEPDDEDIIDFPTLNESEKIIEVKNSDGDYTYPTSMKYKDMKKVVVVRVNIFDGVDYSCLNYFQNLEGISFIARGTHKNLKGFDGSNIKSDIWVQCNCDLKSSDEELFPFLENIPSISRFNFFMPKEAEIDWDYISSFKNVKGLSLYDAQMTGFNIKSFEHLDFLELHGEPFEIAKNFTYDDIEECKKLGIELKYNHMDELMQIVKKPSDDEKIKLNKNIYVSFDDSCDYSQYVQYETMKYGDMKKVKSLAVNIYDKCDYSCLNYFTNVENLVINDYGFECNIDNVYGVNFEKDINIIYYLKSYYNSNCNFLTEGRIDFFKDIPSINTLRIDSDTNGCVQVVDWHYITRLGNVRNLSIYLDPYANFNFQKCDQFNLSKLDTLELRGEPYNVGMFISTDDINQLKKWGVKLKYEQMDKLNEINQKLDNIYSSLNINDSMDDLDKINKIVQYVLESCEYDQEYIAMEDGSAEKNERYYSFYDNGFLYGALEKQAQICGNFSALTNALLKRANVDSFNIHSPGHGWTLVDFRGYYYSLDTTFLDNYEDYMNSDLYLADPTISHPSAEYPEFFHVYRIPEDKKSEINSILIEKMSEGEFINIKDQDIPVAEDNQIYKLTIKDKCYVVSVVALVGILSGLGLGTFITKNKIRRKEEENEHIK